MSLFDPIDDSAVNGLVSAECDKPNPPLIFAFAVILPVILFAIYHLSQSASAETAVLSYYAQTALLQLGTPTAILSWLNIVSLSPQSASGWCVAPLSALEQLALNLAVPLLAAAALFIALVLHRWLARTSFSKLRYQRAFIALYLFTFMTLNTVSQIGRAHV